MPAWPPQPSLLGLAVPLLLPQLAIQSTQPRRHQGEGSQGFEGSSLPSADECLVLQRRSLSCLWFGGRQGKVTQELEGEGGGGPCPWVAEECQTSETQD